MCFCPSLSLSLSLYTYPFPGFLTSVHGKLGNESVGQVIEYDGSTLSCGHVAPCCFGELANSAFPKANIVPDWLVFPAKYAQKIWPK